MAKSYYEQHKYVDDLLWHSGKENWIDVDKCNPAAKFLMDWEPDEVVLVKGRKFAIVRVQLDPPLLVLVPSECECDKWERGEKLGGNL